MAANRLFMVVALVLVIMMVGTVVNGAPQKKVVKCQDKKLPSCYHRNLFCPSTCPQNCHVNCTTCKPVCPAPPPRKVKCQDRKSCHLEMTCPKKCPQNCVADCKSCKPVCAPKSIKVRCEDKRYSRWCHKELTCPVKCPTTCKVDCVHCKPICSAPVVYRPPPPFYNSSPPLVPSPPPPPPSIIPSPAPPPSIIPSPPPPPPSSIPSPVDSSPPPPPPLSIPSPVDFSPPPPPSSVPSPVVSSPPPPPSVPSPPPPSNSSDAAGGRRARCKNKSFPSCYFREHQCPSSCPDSCEVDCVTCSPVYCNKPGTVCQDPRFVGADGLTFYFHGHKDRDFCIVSDNNLHINAHFIGKRNSYMGRDFTWVQSLAILFDNHQIYVGAKKTATWDDSLDRIELLFNKEPIELEEGEGNKWEAASTAGRGVRIARARDTNSVVIEVEGNFKIKATVVPITKQDSKIHKYGITDEDCFAHLDLMFKFYSLSAQVNGVLGQTYASDYVSRVKMGVDMPVLGGQREYATSSLFSADCAVARFHGSKHLTVSDSSDRFEHANMKCESGMDGPAGVVCRK